jgi:hypothetical protein
MQCIEGGKLHKASIEVETGGFGLDDMGFTSPPSPA